jgi:hypothetical protein
MRKLAEELLGAPLPQVHTILSKNCVCVCVCDARKNMRKLAEELLGTAAAGVYNIE